MENSNNYACKFYFFKRYWRNLLFLYGVITKKLGWVLKHDIIKELFEYFLTNYQKEETIMRNGSDFVFESIDLLSYSVHKISLKRGKS